MNPHSPFIPYPPPGNSCNTEPAGKSPAGLDCNLLSPHWDKHNERNPLGQRSPHPPSRTPDHTVITKPCFVGAALAWYGFGLNVIPILPDSKKAWLQIFLEPERPLEFINDDIQEGLA